jgi:hypothetical protein
MKTILYIVSLAIVISAMVLTKGCKKPEVDPIIPTPSGQLQINFDFYAEEAPLIYDSLMYVNEAGNHYLVYEVQYFITRLTIYKNGVAKVLNSWENEHYIDTEIPKTLEWLVVDKIDVGSYDSISFILGFNDSDNASFMFINPPESQMDWPEYDGGGYHYMKLNGKWKSPEGYLRGSAFHLGRGQVYDANHVPISFIDNSFRVSLQGSNFEITNSTITSLTLRMHIEEWFKNPEAYNFNDFGGDIMENQEAMAKACRNGWNVFSIVK